MVAVDGSGVVGVTWFDRRDHPDNLGWTVRFRASLDGGETFGPSVPVSDPVDPWASDPMLLKEVGGILRPGVLELGIHYFDFNAGHTVGFAAGAPGSFHPLWVDTRTGSPQLWTAPVTVSGDVSVNGEPALANLVDVTPDVRIRATNRWWMRESGRVEAELVLENMSQDTIRGPLFVRILSLTSDLGIAGVVNSDGGGNAEGAFWDLTAYLEDDILAPGARTQPKELAFTVDNLGALEINNYASTTSLAAMRVKVLAGARDRSANR